MTDKYEKLKEIFKEYAGNDVEGIKDYETIIGFIEQEAEQTKPTITKQEIMSVKDGNKRMQLINENMELFQ